MTNRGARTDEFLLKYKNKTEEQLKDLDNLMFASIGAKNWVYHDPISERCYVWVRPYKTDDFSRNALCTPNIKPKLIEIEMDDFERVSTALMVAELHSFLQLKEVKSLFSDKLGAEQYLIDVRTKLD